jgi:acyl-CoA synthetase (NDP forming)
LDLLDKTLEPRLLLPLLSIPPEARPYFVELFERLEFRRRSKRTPSYRPSEHQRTLMAARYTVENRPRTETQAKAIVDAAQYWGLSKTALEKAVKGRHTSLRRRGRR